MRMHTNTHHTYTHAPFHRRVHAHAHKHARIHTHHTYKHTNTLIRGLENAEKNGMGDGGQLSGEEEGMGGEPKSEEREESGVQAGPAQHSNARRHSCNIVATSA